MGRAIFFTLLFMLKPYFGFKMCTVELSLRVNTFQIDDKDLTTNTITERESEQISKMDDTLVSHPPIYIQ